MSDVDRVLLLEAGILFVGDFNGESATVTPTGYESKAESANAASYKVTPWLSAIDDNLLVQLWSQVLLALASEFPDFGLGVCVGDSGVPSAELVEKVDRIAEAGIPIDIVDVFEYSRIVDIANICVSRLGQINE